MKIVKVPKFLQELLGEETTKIEMMLIFGFAILAEIAILIATHNEWISLKWYQIVLLVVLMFDIYGGVIANFSYGTNKQYSGPNKARLLFISIHVQPLLLALVLGQYMMPSAIVWAITIIGALIVNAYRGSIIQRSVGGIVMVVNLMIILLFFATLPKYLLILYVLFVIKVCFSFSVDHYDQRADIA